MASNTYDKLNNKIKSVDGLKAVTGYEYDFNHNLLKETNALNKSKAYEYDGNDNLIRFENEKQQVLKYDYDAMNNLTAKKGLTNTTKTAYDQYNNVLSDTDDYKLKTTYEYNKFNQLVKQTNNDKSGIAYAYDYENNLLETKTKDDTIKNKYNDYNEIISVTNKAGTLKYVYNNIGLVTNYTNVNKQEVAYTYNKQLDVAKLNYHDKSVAYDYDQYHNIIKTKENNKAVETAIYDGFNRPIKTVKANGVVIAKKYDVQDKTTEIKTSLKHKNIETTTYTYDLLANPTKEVKLDQEGKQVKALSYNEVGELAQSKITANNKTTTNTYTYDLFGNKLTLNEGKVVEQYEYNEHNQLSRIVSPEGNKQLAYDGNGNVVKETNQDGTVNELSYNGLNQLVAYENKKVTYAYEYDGNNDRVKQTIHDLTVPDQVLQSFMKLDTILVDLNNGVDVCGVGYNTDQSLSGEEEFDKYTDRIMEKSKQLEKGLNYCQNYEPSTELSTGTRLVNNNNIETITYLNNGLSNSLLLSEDSNFNQNDKDYVYGNERIKANDRYYVSKLNRTVSKVLDAKGQVTNSYEYNDYGSEIKDTKQRGFLYNGEYVDNNKLQYLRARYYESGSKQFIQKDTYTGELNQINSQNQYSYALNNPYKYVDDSGNVAVFALAALNTAGLAAVAVAKPARQAASRGGNALSGVALGNTFSTTLNSLSSVASKKNINAAIAKANNAKSVMQAMINAANNMSKKAAANLSKKSTKAKAPNCNINNNYTEAMYIYGNYNKCISPKADMTKIRAYASLIGDLIFTPAADSVVYFFQHPIKATENLLYALFFPLETLKNMATTIGKNYSTIQKEYGTAAALYYVFLEGAFAVAGTKGTSEALKALGVGKVTTTSKVATKADDVVKTAEKGASSKVVTSKFNLNDVNSFKNANIKDVEKFLDEKIADGTLAGFKKETLRDGNGIRYNNGKGKSWQLNYGYDNSWTDIHGAPYLKYSDGGITRVPLTK